VPLGHGLPSGGANRQTPVVAFLILHGLEGSGSEHWQTWLAGRLRERGLEVAYPDLPDGRPQYGVRVTDVPKQGPDEGGPRH